MKTLKSHVVRDHVLLGGVVAFMLLPLFGISGCTAFWFATVLIDIDHFFIFFYLTKFKEFRLRLVFPFYEQVFQRRNRPEFLTVEIFHTAEFIILFALITITVVPSLEPVLFGFLFHLCVDAIHLYRFKVINKRSHSLLEYFWRRKKMLSLGMNPDSIFKEALSFLELPL